MKIASFNVNSIRSRLPIVLDWLATGNADVLCVQETKVQDHEFPKEAFEKIGFNAAFKGQKSYNGVAIFSNSSIENVEFGLETEPKDEPRLIKAVINGITIVNTYIPQGNSPESEKFQYKLQWFDRLLDYFDKKFKPSDPMVWVGDLNIAPEAIDVYDPEGLWGNVCYHPQVQKKLQVLMEWGLTDVFRKHCKAAGEYTFWDYRVPNVMQRNYGWRLDHIMATKILAEKSKNCWVDKKPRTLEKPSDHTPIIAEFSPL